MTPACIARAAIAALVLAVGCAGARDADPGARGDGPPPRRLAMWLLSDIQPREVDERADLERAIADVDERVGPVDLAVIAGDLLHSGSAREDFDWLEEALARSRVPHWYAIAGNHDARNARLFEERLNDRSPRAVEVGNLLLLLLSDESKDSRTDLSDAVFEWWRDAVLGAGDRIVITVSHAQLAGSGLLASLVPSRVVAGSERFEAVLREHPVALWVSGHTHLPHWAPWTLRCERDLGGSCFVNVSAIRSDAVGDSESRLLVLEDGSREMRIRVLDHTDGRDVGDATVLELERPFRWDGSPPRPTGSPFR